MEKKEFKVGEEFQLGLKRLKCVEDNESCDGCFFDNNFPLRCRISIIGHCTKMHRMDRTSVIFIEVKDETI